MNALLFRQVVAGFALSIGLCALACAQGTDGTFQLVQRKLPDGTILTPPAVHGMFTNKNGINTLLVFWSSPEGKPASISQITKWEFSDKEVAVTPVLMIFDDGSGKPVVYALGGEIKRSPVTREGGRVSYQHPTNTPFVVWEGNDKLTATLEGVFVDYWKRVK